MFINTERKYVKKTIFFGGGGISRGKGGGVPQIQDPICCVNFFYEFKVILIGFSCI